jgi:hypothetical protein
MSSKLHKSIVNKRIALDDTQWRRGVTLSWRGDCSRRAHASRVPGLNRASTARSDMAIRQSQSYPMSPYIQSA